MNANMTIRRIGRLIPAVLAATMLFASVEAQAVQTIATPSARTITYNLAPGASTAAITIPSNTPVQIMGTQETAGFRGVASATMLSIPGAGGFIEWTGLESTNGSVITQGFSGVAGTHILFLDFSHQVDVEVASPNQIRVTNSSTGNRTGRITLVW